MKSIRFAVGVAITFLAVGVIIAVMPGGQTWRSRLIAEYPLLRVAFVAFSLTVAATTAYSTIRLLLGSPLIRSTSTMLEAVTFWGRKATPWSEIAAIEAVEVMHRLMLEVTKLNGKKYRVAFRPLDASYTDVVDAIAAQRG